MMIVKIKPEECTLENFVDVVNEMLYQISNDELKYNKIQSMLNKFLKNEVSFDNFALDFSMLMMDFSL